MTQEEKVRAYDEAIKKAKEIKEKIVHSHLSTESCKAVSEYIDTIIPELAESEDERIRKDIVALIKFALTEGSAVSPGSRTTKEEALAYLEKQKEQKQILDFKASNWYVSKVDGKIHDMDDSNPNKKYYSGVDDTLSNIAGILHGVYSEEKLKEQEPAEWNKATINGEPISTENQSVDIPLAEWSEEDKDYYDTIVRKLEVIGDDSGLSNNQIKFLREHCPSHRSEWDEEDERIRQSIIKDLEFERNYTSATIAKADNLIRKYNEQINLLKSLPERFNLQPKQEWSEKDDEIRKALIAFLEMNIGYFSCNGFTKYDIIQWLKSLPERFNTQPKQEWSEEDGKLFELLHTCVCRCINDDRLEYAEREQISKKIIPFIERLEK